MLTDFDFSMSRVYHYCIHLEKKNIDVLRFNINLKKIQSYVVSIPSRVVTLWSQDRQISLGEGNRLSLLMLSHFKTPGLNPVLMHKFCV